VTGEIGGQIDAGGLGNLLGIIDDLLIGDADLIGLPQVVGHPTAKYVVASAAVLFIISCRWPPNALSVR
jgi:hypothetical protein